MGYSNSFTKNAHVGHLHKMCKDPKRTFA